MGYDRRTALQAELKAIELWNNLFESEPNNEIYAAGFECRQRRTAEIVIELSRSNPEQEVQAELEHNAPSTGIVLCTLSHDLQNKLSVIIGQCDLLSQNAIASVDCKQRIQSIRVAAEAMSDMLKTSLCPGGMH